MFLWRPPPAHLVLLSSSICRGHAVLAASAGVLLIAVGGHLLGRPLSKHLVQVEPAPVAHEERAHLQGRTTGLSGGEPAGETCAKETEGWKEGLRLT